jgi:hypothetical protein
VSLGEFFYTNHKALVCQLNLVPTNNEQNNAKNMQKPCVSASHKKKNHGNFTEFAVIFLFCGTFLWVGPFVGLTLFVIFVGWTFFGTDALFYFFDWVGPLFLWG